MQTWFGFYAVIAGAAATLTGLLFVAVSVNVAAILGDAQGNSRRLAEQAFQNYLAVLLVSLLALFPSMTLAELGFVTLCVTAAWTIWVQVRAYLALTRPNPGGSRLHSLRRHSASLIGFGMLTFAALRMAWNVGDSRNLFAVATIILLFSAAAVSWELLIKISKAKEGGPSG
ncbi:MAG TPA: hypothetical protein VJY34_24455 [Roseiarcus sp.]|nr:hypothetical protein [Roseiarcus sp.]